MVDFFHSYRNPKRGIVLISTLISLMLVIGLVMVAQSAALGNIKTIKRLSADVRYRVLQDSVRELARPLVIDLMINFDGATVWKMGPEGNEAEISEIDFIVTLTREQGHMIESQPKSVIIEISPSNGQHAGSMNRPGFTGE